MQTAVQSAEALSTLEEGVGRQKNNRQAPRKRSIDCHPLILCFHLLQSICSTHIPGGTGELSGFMINEQWRYFAPGGALMPGGPSTWYILDWDQRRVIAVTMDEEQESEDVAVGHLKKHIDDLASDVYAISLSQHGGLVSTSTDPKDDETTCVYYPPPDAVVIADRVKTVLRWELLELDRLSPNVDLVSYATSTDTRSVRAVFKYYFLFQFLHKVWHEMNLWIRLPPHPNIVPFDRIVLDELNGNVVGFTSVYIPGGTLEENTSRIFKLKWLQQLTSVVDDLNLKHGIVHQDIAARNLLVDPETDALMLFDFNFSGQNGGKGYSKDRDDVKGVVFTLYEIITRDKHHREMNYEQQDPSLVAGLETWPQHPDVKLDHPVSDYRTVLKDWMGRRREREQITVYTEAPDFIDWPSFPTPAPRDQIFSDGFGNSTVVQGVVMYDMRRDEREKGAAVLNWERPAQNKLSKGDRVFANGHLKPATKHTDLDGSGHFACSS